MSGHDQGSLNIYLDDLDQLTADECFASLRDNLAFWKITEAKARANAIAIRWNIANRKANALKQKASARVTAAL